MILNLKVLASCVLLASVGLPSRAGDPVVGDDRPAVIKQIGKPRGRMTMGEKETLLYDRGSVELSTGRVSRVKLVTPEVLAEQLAEKEKAARLAEEARLARVAEGEKARDDLLANDAYKAGTPAEKVAAWEKFRQDHPEVTPPSEYQQAVQARQISEQKAAAGKEETAPHPERP